MRRARRLTLAQIFERVTNLTLHIKTDVQVPWRARRLLSFGPKFIPSPQTPVLHNLLSGGWSAGSKSAFNALLWSLSSTGEAAAGGKRYFYHHFPTKSNGGFTPSAANLDAPRRRFALAFQHGSVVVGKIIKEKLGNPERGFRRNVSDRDLEALHSLLSDPSCRVVLADKNMGFAVVDSIWLRDAILAQLTDGRRYESLSEDVGRGRLSWAMEAFNELLSKLKISSNSDKNVIFGRMKKVMKAKGEPSPCGLKPLAKVHKPSLQLRLITQAHRSPFQSFNGWFSRFIHPVIIKRVPSWLRDSTHLLDALRGLPLDPLKRYTILVADATNLYGNLPLALVRDALAWALDVLAADGVLPRQAIPTLLELLVLTNQNNFVEFEGVWYQQLLGIAMGRADGVDLANLALGYVEKRMAALHVLLFKRYIDDAILIVEGGRDDALREATVFFQATKLEWTPETFEFPPLFTSESAPSDPRLRAPFLDLLIWRSGTSFLTSLHVKETNLGLYIPRRSFHPRHSFSGWIRAEVDRFARCCSSERDFLFHRKRFYYALLARGYSSSYLIPLLAVDHEKRRAEILASLFSRCAGMTYDKAVADKTRRFGSTIYVPAFYHPYMDRIPASFVLNHGTKPTLEALNQEEVLNPHRQYQIRFSIAWRSLPNLATAVELALRRSLGGAPLFPNPNRGPSRVVRDGAAPTASAGPAPPVTLPFAEEDLDGVRSPFGLSLADDDSLL